MTLYRESVETSSVHWNRRQPWQQCEQSIKTDPASLFLPPPVRLIRHRQQSSYLDASHLWQFSLQMQTPQWPGIGEYDPKMILEAFGILVTRISVEPIRCTPSILLWDIICCQGSYIHGDDWGFYWTTNSHLNLSSKAVRTPYFGGLKM